MACLIDWAVHAPRSMFVTCNWPGVCPPNVPPPPTASGPDGPVQGADNGRHSFLVRGTPHGQYLGGVDTEQGMMDGGRGPNKSQTRAAKGARNRMEIERSSGRAGAEGGSLLAAAL